MASKSWPISRHKQVRADALLKAMEAQLITVNHVQRQCYSSTTSHNLVHFDQQLRFEAHAKNVTAKGMNMVPAALTMLAKTILYTSPAWFSGRRYKAKHLEKVQNQALQLICTVFHTLPIKALEVEASVPPITLHAKIDPDPDPGMTRTRGARVFPSKRAQKRPNRPVFGRDMSLLVKGSYLAQFLPDWAVLGLVLKRTGLGMMTRTRPAPATRPAGHGFPKPVVNTRCAGIHLNKLSFLNPTIQRLPNEWCCDRPPKVPAPLKANRGCMVAHKWKSTTLLKLPKYMDHRHEHIDPYLHPPR
ncbi:hypothetical protein DFP72DRAFT_846037 [Ephemerocybe angulata]|uniref:Uncharacterized protein n=1 Tax=Ephemerocybe angulata TaxID=980116 RepID=A0A8H6I362_9AGAR|nr:hypothetical protein DFP72DRAFT_846037 [Tulosesus angulatus]